MRSLRVLRSLLPALALATPLGISSAVSAAAPMDAIYLCIDADGHKSYQNSADGTACHRIDGVVSTIPAVDLDRSRSARSIPSRPMVSPASFPRVDVSTQRLRDSDRRRILEDELRSEQEHLAQLRSEFNQGRPQPSGDETPGTPRYQAHVQRLFDDIERSEANIASLRRELTPTRY